MIYLDWNATTPLHPAAGQAMALWWGRPANASSLHGAGQAAAMALDEARGQVARSFGWDPTGVVFTSGATEANAIVLASGRWAVSAVEHPSVAAWGAEVLPVDADGRVDLAHLSARLAAGVDRVSVMAANNETGVLQPLGEVSLRCSAAGALLHVDASQVPGRVPLPWGPGQAPDYLTFSAHKVGGPVGVGALLVSRVAPLVPLQRGGRQERGRRAGTVNVIGAVGFAAALRACHPLPGEPRPGSMLPLRDGLEAELSRLGGEVLGGLAPRLPNTSCVVFPGWEAGDLVAALDLDGVAVSAGAACASGAPEASPVLRAMGRTGSAVRFSLGPTSTEVEIGRAVEVLASILRRAAPVGSLARV